MVKRLVPSFAFLWLVLSLFAGAQEIFQRTVSSEGELSWGIFHEMGDGRYLLAAHDGIGNARMTLFHRDGSVEWSRRYRNAGMDQAEAFARGNGRYFLAGNVNFPQEYPRALVIATDTLGNIIWSRSIGQSKHNQTAHDVAATSDGGAIITGAATSYASGGTALLTARLDRDGNIRWARTIESDTATDLGESVGRSVVETADGFMVIGTTGRDSSRKTLVVKFSPEGTLLWSKQYSLGGSLDAKRMIGTDDGGFVFVGTWTPYDHVHNRQACVTHFDSAGTILWSRIGDAPYPDAGTGICAAGGGRIAITASRSDYPGLEHVMRFTLLDADGNLLQSREYEPKRLFGAPEGITLARDGFLVTSAWKTFLMMHTDAEGNAGCSQTDNHYGVVPVTMTSREFPMVTATVDSFSVLSTKTVELPTDIYILCNGDPAPPAPTSDRIISSTGFTPVRILPFQDGALVAGRVRVSVPHLNKFALMKISSTGVPVWQKLYGNEHDGLLTDAILTSDGGVLLIGQGQGYQFEGKLNALADIYIVKLDSLQHPQWSKILFTSSFYNHLAAYETPNHDFLINAGADTSTDSFKELRALFITRINSQGNYVESIKLLADSATQIHQMLVTRDGGLLIGGIVFDGLDPQLFAARFDASGAMLWNHTFETDFTRSYDFTMMKETTDGVTITGDFFILHLDSVGIPQWGYVYDNAPGGWVNQGDSCIATSDGGFLYCGVGEGIPLMVKVDSLGRVNWSYVYSRNSEFGAPAGTGFTGVVQLAEGGYVAYNLNSGPLGGCATSPVNTDGQSRCGSVPYPMLVTKLHATIVQLQNIRIMKGSTLTVDVGAEAEDYPFSSVGLCIPDASVSPFASGKSELSFRPDPVRRGAHATLLLPLDFSGSVEISISDSRGGIVMRHSETSESCVDGNCVSIDTRSFSPGLYIATVKHHGTVIYGKLMVN